MCTILPPGGYPIAVKYIIILINKYDWMQIGFSYLVTGASIRFCEDGNELPGSIKAGESFYLYSTFNVIKKRLFCSSGGIVARLQSGVPDIAGRGVCFLFTTVLGQVPAGAESLLFSGYRCSQPVTSN
jgi:hypothetical protein